MARLVLPNMLHPIPFNLLKHIADDATPVFHNASAMILILVDKRGVGSPMLYACICGQNMVLAAHSLGVGTCWVGMLTMIMKLPKWRKRFGVSYPYSLDDCLAIGWPRADYDGEVDREVQLVEWHRPGGLRSIEEQGPEMAYLSLLDFFKVADYFDSRVTQTGRMAFDAEICTGCGICAAICPSRGLVLNGKLPAMVKISSDSAIAACLACGDCLAACPKGAIHVEQGYAATGYFRKTSQTEQFRYPKKY